MKEHTGHIIKIEGNTVTVKVLQLSACAHCEGKKYCTLAEAKEKEIKICVKNPSIYTVGEEVEIIAHKKQLSSRASRRIFPFWRKNFQKYH